MDEGVCGRPPHHQTPQFIGMVMRMRELCKPLYHSELLQQLSKSQTSSASDRNWLT